MDTLVWNQELYTVGVEKIDTQHKKLFEIVAKLDEVVNEDDQSKMSNFYMIMDDLLEYASTHFHDEEEFFAKHPDFQSHRDSHLKFANDLGNIANDIIIEKNQEKIRKISFELLLIIKRWLVAHVMNVDKKVFSDLGYCGPNQNLSKISSLGFSLESFF